jgi:CheY-like chemotaxis protein/nucleoside 2-deoxyribosyltransferase
MKKLSIYLAGPITGLDKQEALSWRNEFKVRFGECHEIKIPLDRDIAYEGLEGLERFRRIAYGERLDILNSDATIAVIDRPSMGTAMGIMYAYLSGRTVVIIHADPSIKLSPMVCHHNHFITDSVEHAISFIEMRHSRSTITHIVKRNGNHEDWEQIRIANVIQKAINAVMKDCPECADIAALQAEKLAEAVVMKLEDDLDGGQAKHCEITVEFVQDAVERLLMTNSHLDEVVTLAKAYIIYRSKRHEERERRQTEISSHIAEESTKEFITTILHDIKSPIGIIGNASNLVRKNISNGNIEKALQLLDKLDVNQQRMLAQLDNFKSENEQRFAKNIINLKEFFEDIAIAFDIDDEKRLVFKTQIPADIFIETRPHKLQLIFNVLFDNARSHGFAGDGGNVFIKVSPIEESDDIEILYWNDGKPITIANADFILSADKHYPPQKGHWKYGLLGAKSYVNDLGGTIQCYPVEVQDDPFSVAPAREGLICFRIVFRQVKRTEMTKRRILIADDDANHRESINTFLEDDFELTLVGSINDALDILREGNIDGFISDVDFGEDRDGIWLVEQAKRIAPTLRIAVMSGLGSEDARRGDWKHQAELLGARAYEKQSSYIDDLIEYLNG